MKPRQNPLLVVLLCLGVADLSKGASFDCTHAKTSPEKAICADPDLSKLDDELAREYETSLKESPNPSLLREEQADWLANYRSWAFKPEDLRRVYRSRIEELKMRGPVMTHEFYTCKYGSEKDGTEMADVSVLLIRGYARARWRSAQYASGYYGCGLTAAGSNGLRIPLPASADADWKVDSSDGTYRFINTGDLACSFTVKVTSAKVYFLAPIVGSSLAKNLWSCGCGMNGAYLDIELDRRTNQCKRF